MNAAGPLPSHIAGKYQLQGLIGEGGMGVVLAAVDTTLQRQVAIKMLRWNHASRQGSVARFFREARAAAQLQGEHVVRVYDVGNHDGRTPYIAMEYLAGVDLATVLAQRRQLGLEEIVGYVLQSCEGLAEAHAMGTVHRDVKPSNLFLAHRVATAPCLKVLDFGIAATANSAGAMAITDRDELVGTPTYMAPEQMLSARAAGIASDIWSLGIILYEALVGAPPFEEKNPVALMVRTRSVDAPSLSSARPDLPRELAAVVARCLCRDPDARFANVGELAAALARFGGAGAADAVYRVFGMLSGRPSDTVQRHAVPSATDPTQVARGVRERTPA